MGLDLDVWIPTDNANVLEAHDFMYSLPQHEGWEMVFDWRKHYVLDSCLFMDGCSPDYKYLSRSDINHTKLVLMGYWNRTTPHSTFNYGTIDKYQAQDMAFIARAHAWLAEGVPILAGRIN